MIIKSQSPCRISLAGGGSDISPFCDLYGGATVSLAINIYQRFTLLTDNDMWGNPEIVIEKSQVPNGCSLDFVYAFRERFGVNSMHHNKFLSESDGGIRAGIGSSAAIAVAIVAALNKSQGITMSRSETAELAWEIETKDLGLFGGKQDQYAAAHGGLNLFEFTDKVNVSPFDRKYADAITPHLLLFHTNLERKDPKLQEGFKKLDGKQIKALNQVKSLVAPSIEAIGNGDIQVLGEILDTAWHYKKQSNKGISNPRIAQIYEYSKKHGAIGGKVCGAGGGGCMVFLIKSNRDEFIKRMTQYGLTHMDYSLDSNGAEVRVL